MMESHKAPVDRSTTPGGIEDLSSPGETAKHFVKQDVVITISGGDNVGEVKHLLTLDTSLDDALHSIAKQYERWTIKDFKIYLQSASPLGSASGGLQLCHVPDPDNGFFDGTRNSVEKSVRQANSIFIKPRDSHTMTIDFEFTKFTKLAGSSRWSNFGTVACIVRSTPESTDWATWNFTVEFTALFYRPCIIDDTISFILGREISKAELTDDDLKVSLSAPVFADEVVMKFTKGFRMVIRETREGIVSIRPVKTLKLNLVSDDQGRLVYKFPAGLKIVKLITQMVDATVILLVRGSMLECL